MEIFTGNPFSDSFVSENRFKRVFDEQVDNTLRPNSCYDVEVCAKCYV